MLSDIHVAQRDSVCAPKPDDRWSRNIKDDMKEAIDYLFKFKESLDKLHPECTRVIEKMLQANRVNY